MAYGQIAPQLQSLNIASTGGFRYSISGLARNRKPRGDSILMGGY